jgi:hypothetical protein
VRNFVFTPCLVKADIFSYLGLGAALGIKYLGKFGRITASAQKLYAIYKKKQFLSENLF